EPNETFFVNLSSPTNATLVDGQGQGTIVNDDAAQPGQLQFSAATYSVGEAAGQATITLTRTGGSDGAVAVTFASSGGTATAGVDFTAVTTTVSFSAGQTVATVTIPIINDNIDESDETVNLALSGPTGGATLGTPNTAVLTIIDDDPAPSLRISDVTVTEGNSGTTAAVFTVTLSAASGQTVTVNFATADGTATTVAPADYQFTSGVLTFSAGQTSQTVTVLVNGDTAVEPDETFFVNLSGAANATIADNQGQATIINDDLATVESVVINQQRADGAFQSQRSLVTDVTVTFNSRVTFVGNPVDAFRLVNRTTGAVVGLMAQVTTDATGAKTVVILRFTGAGIVNGSLADGRYELTVDGEMIRDAAGQFVDADNNGTAGGDLIYGDDQTREAFFRLFGDANGDGRVDLTRAVGNDVDLFFGTMLKRQGDPGYLAFFDYNGDGQIDGLDYFQFNQRRGRSI
ncbi:MAG TPA: Calx-beta domain-containing protein, partial [Gemmataceae bacterium]|nr:Calx-beta domain-containing protein [Gemmataceae bacterium]